MTGAARLHSMSQDESCHGNLSGSMESWAAVVGRDGHNNGHHNGHNNGAPCCSIIGITASLACTSPPLRFARGRKGRMTRVGGEHQPQPN